MFSAFHGMSGGFSLFAPERCELRHCSKIDRLCIVYYTPHNLLDLEDAFGARGGSLIWWDWILYNFSVSPRPHRVWGMMGSGRFGVLVTLQLRLDVSRHVKV